MKNETFFNFTRNIGIELENTDKLIDIFTNINALINYANSRNYNLSEREAGDLILQFRDYVSESKAQPLSDESLDLVSGAGTKQVHWS